MLRYYEEKGLLEPTRKPNGYREYSNSDVGRVTCLREMFRRGLSAQMIMDNPQRPHQLEQPTDSPDLRRAG